jgi:electron transfer flavoprotein beta subunit
VREMNIVVLAKQVPDTTDVKLDPKTGTLIREGVPSIINPDDKHAIEAALALREETGGGKITVLSMGPPQAEDALREALAMGVDEAVLLSDRAFAGADTLATSYTLALGVRKVGEYDLVICGRQAIDGDTAQIGPQVAEFLELPQITYVRKIELKDGKAVVAERAMEDGYELIQAPLPALLTCIGGLNVPRYPTVKGIVKACREQKIPVWGAADLGVTADAVGLNGSPTAVKRSFAPEPKGECQMGEGDLGHQVDCLMDFMLEENLIK